MTTPMDALPPWLAVTLLLAGAACFGAIVGWLVYFINRYRTGAVQFGDLVTVMGVIGGAAVLNLFPEKSALFGAYGIGLAIGFFGYLAMLRGLVRHSMTSKGAFSWEWFLDGRRKNPGSGEGFSGDVDRTQTPLLADSGGKPAP